MATERNTIPWYVVHPAVQFLTFYFLLTNYNISLVKEISQFRLMFVDPFPKCFKGSTVASRVQLASMSKATAIHHMEFALTSPFVEPKYRNFW
jgi:hypothetical protein